MKQKRQIGILFILLVAGAIVWGWNFRDKRVVTADATPNLQDPHLIDVPNPHINLEQIGRVRSAEYKGSGRNPFSPAAAPAAPAARVAQGERKFENYGPWQKPPDPPPPPVTLPPNVKFYGYGSVNGAARHAFFYDGDDEHILGEGDVLLKRFRIIRIGNDHIEFAEISSGRVGTAPIEAEAPPGQQQ